MVKNVQKQSKKGSKQSKMVQSKNSGKTPNWGRALRARPPFGGLRLIFDCFVPFFDCFGPFLIVFSDFLKFLIKLILRLFNGSFGQRPLVGEADLGVKPMRKQFIQIFLVGRGWCRRHKDGAGVAGGKPDANTTN